MNHIIKKRGWSVGLAKGDSFTGTVSIDVENDIKPSVSVEYSRDGTAHIWKVSYVATEICETLTIDLPGKTFYELGITPEYNRGVTHGRNEALDEAAALVLGDWPRGSSVHDVAREIRKLRKDV